MASTVHGDRRLFEGAPCGPDVGHGRRGGLGAGDGCLVVAFDLLFDLLDDAVVVPGLFKEGELVLNKRLVDPWHFAQKCHDQFSAHAMDSQKVPANELEVYLVAMFS
jgi:hypothetical protein